MWEHKSVAVSSSYSTQMINKNIQNCLDEYSFAGWELVDVTFVKTTDSTHILFFKRPVDTNIEL